MATQTVEQVTRLAPFQEQFLKNIFAQAEALKGTPQPFSPQQLAGLSEGQQKAISLAQQGVGSYQPFLDRAAQFAGPGGASQFMNPFENQVVQQTLKDIGTQGQKAQAQLGGSGVASGAFGGSRFGVAQADLAGKTLEQQARSAGQLRQQGFQQAQQAAQNAARLQAGLGQAQQQMGIQDINQLLGIGSLQQRQQQAGFDVARANELGRQALPFQEIGFLSDIFRGVPALQSTMQTTSTPSPSLGSQLLGLGIAGLGAAGQAQGFGNLFGGFGGG
tara:strand:- start:2967 stop:3791 length:825 start_codon:yes stop_codon:yes gene_type:complete